MHRCPVERESELAAVRNEHCFLVSVEVLVVVRNERCCPALEQEPAQEQALEQEPEHNAADGVLAQ